jgi:hypothetical protein
VTTSSTLQPAPEVAGRDLAELSRRFPDVFIERKEGNDYVAHHVVNQRLLSIVGPFDFELVEVLRGDVAAVPPDPAGRSRRAKAGTPALHNVVVGGIWRLTCWVDGQQVRIEEVGDVGDVHNWPHDGARLKDAVSDALKRCAMRLGLGLHLWAQEHYYLDDQLRTVPEQAGGARMPLPGSVGWEAPDQDLVERFDALVEAAGVDPADAAEFLRRSPYYGGVADPRELHGPTLARLVERLAQGGDKRSGLAAFRAKVEAVLGEPTRAPAGRR